MILRKPYALLIQYFQKIHLVLILLCAYIFYKLTFLTTFVSDFVKTESYNSYYEPISSYINVFLIISVIIVIITTITLIILLRYKKKPWKVYLFPLLEYTLILGLLIYITSYFNKFTELSSIPAIMAARDLLNIASIFQYAIFVIFGIRFLGIDLKKFGFTNDEEYLDIKEEDREEFEVNIEFDKDKIKRTYKKFIRNAKCTCVSDFSNVWKRICYRLLQAFLSVYSKRWLACKIRECLMKYSWETSEYVSSLASWSEKYPILKSNFDKGVSVWFEGKQYNAPMGYDNWLKLIYPQSVIRDGVSTISNDHH